ncbi:hypothetical protein R3P38DRAFT_3199410 [Favolaschia claudopus]|uniref:F-box domain-containing protein n=1 Tax=Favolaschia claudopus TaxID=2862362 RepID=A0AAW0B161_9AGAR
MSQISTSDTSVNETDSAEASKIATQMSQISPSVTSVNETDSARPSKFMTLPLDTVARIFLYALRPVITQEQIYENELLRDRLRRTCTLFKQVVDSLPVMWSFLMLEAANDRRPSPLDTSDLYAFVSEHLQKSAMSPLHIAFDLTVLPLRRDEPGRVWDALLPTVKRWRSLFFRADGSCSLAGLCVEELLGPNIIVDALDLRVVDIEKKTNLSCWKRHQRLQLVSVNLHLVRCTILVDVAFPPSPNLQYMYIASDRDQQDMNWSAFFSACTNLLHLKWDRRCAVASSPVVSMPSLLLLSLWDLRFLPPIFAPRLTEMELLDDSTPISVNLLVDLVGFAACLTSLKLRNNPVKTFVLLDILKRTPYLEHIVMSDMESRAPIFEFLAKRIIYQYRMNTIHRLNFVAVHLTHQMQETENSRIMRWDLEDLCPPRSCSAFNCLCFEPFAFGTCIVILDFPFPLMQREVAAVYSQDDVTSYTGFEVPVLKVWVPERIQFGKTPKGSLTMVVLLGLKWEKADIVASFGFEYGRTRYKVFVEVPCGIHNVPIELLTRIFKFTLPAPLATLDDPHKDRHSIRCVSAYWRQVTDQDASLWTVVRITERTKLPKLTFIRTHASGLPLQVVAIFGARAFATAGTAADRISLLFAKLLPLLSASFSIRLRVESRSACEPVLRLFAHLVPPTLGRIVFDFCPSLYTRRMMLADGRDTSLASLTFLHHLPSIDWSISVQSVTRLTLAHMKNFHHPRLMVLRQVFAALPNLASLSVRFVNCSLPLSRQTLFDLVDHKVVMVNLERVEVFLDCNELVWMLACLDMPALRTLALRLPDGRPVHAITRNSPGVLSPLSRLVLSSGAITISALEMLMRASPGLEELDGSGAGDDFLFAFHGLSLHQKGLCPQLRSVTFAFITDVLARDILVLRHTTNFSAALCVVAPARSTNSTALLGRVAGRDGVELVPAPVISALLIHLENFANEQLRVGLTRFYNLLAAKFPLPAAEVILDDSGRLSIRLLPIAQDVHLAPMSCNPVLDDSALHEDSPSDSRQFSRSAFENCYVNTLPVELLAILFALVGQGLSPSAAQFRALRCDLSRVCQLWRGVVDTSPFFWSTLSISPMSTAVSVEKFVDVSGSRPIRVVVSDKSRKTLVQTYQQRVFGVQHLERLVHLTFDTIPRWEALWIVSVNPRMVQAVVDIVTVFSPRTLVEFGIRCQGFPFAIAPPPYRPIFYEKMVDLTVSGTQFPFRLVRSLACLKRLRLIDLQPARTSWPADDDMLALFSVAQRLCFLEIRGFGVSIDVPRGSSLPSQKIRVPLRALHLVIDHRVPDTVPDLFRFFKRLALPWLQDLTLAFATDRDVAMYIDSGLVLSARSVRLEGTFFTAERIGRLLGSLGSSTVLDVSRCTLPHILDCLAAEVETDGVTSMVLPALQSLVVRGSWWTELYRGLLKRSSQGYSLRSLDFVEVDGNDASQIAPDCMADYLTIPLLFPSAKIRWIV